MTTPRFAQARICSIWREVLQASPRIQHSRKALGLEAGRRIQVRADVFSVLNRKNYNSPNQSTNSSNFGRITGAGGNRSFQLGARMTF